MTKTLIIFTLANVRQPVKGGSYMADGRVARVTEVIAGSTKGFDDAVKIAFERANATLRNITGMKIMEFSVNCGDGKINEYRVRLEVIFILE